MRICLLCTNEAVKSRLNLHFGANFEWITFTSSITDFDNFAAVFIVESYIAKGRYLSISSIWRHYLKLHYPAIKLIVAGFDANTTSNYISLLELHADFDLTDKIEAAVVVSEAENGLYPTNSYGLVIDRLRPFFTGHNYESIIDSVSKVRLLLNNVELSLYGSQKMARPQESFATIWAEKLWRRRRVFQHFYSRWDHYKDYFEALPFCHLLEAAEVQQFVDGLSGVFSQRRKLSNQQLDELEDRYKKLDPFNRIGEITAIFRKINTNYINPKIVGNMLLIDDDEDFHHQIKTNFTNFSFQSMFNEKELSTLSQEDKFDLILLDLNLEGESTERRLSGLDWIAKLKELYPKTPLGIVSINDTPEIIRHAVVDEGADFFFSKEYFNAEKWTTILFKLLGYKRYSLAEINRFNENEEWYDSPKVLVIEDEDDWFQRIEKLTTDYHFIRANTVPQAKELLRLHHIDLVIVDLYSILDGQKHLTGGEIIKYLQNRQFNAQVIVNSMEYNPDVQKLLGELPVFKFLPKDGYKPEVWLEVFQIAIDIKRSTDKVQKIG